RRRAVLTRVVDRQVQSCAELHAIASLVVDQLLLHLGELRGWVGESGERLHRLLAQVAQGVVGRVGGRLAGWENALPIVEEMERLLVVRGLRLPKPSRLQSR